MQYKRLNLFVRAIAEISSVDKEKRSLVFPPSLRVDGHPDAFLVANAYRAKLEELTGKTGYAKPRVLKDACKALEFVKFVRSRFSMHDVGRHLPEIGADLASQCDSDGMLAGLALHNALGCNRGEMRKEYLLLMQQKTTDEAYPELDPKWVLRGELTGGLRTEILNFCESPRYLKEIRHKFAWASDLQLMAEQISLMVDDGVLIRNHPERCLQMQTFRAKAT